MIALDSSILVGIIKGEQDSDRFLQLLAADVASHAFTVFGSGHPAKLNFGDCMAYAVSTVMRAPLLFKGGDFGQTDVMAYPASIRT